MSKITHRAEEAAAAQKAAKYLVDKYGYVVVCILPHVKDKYPRGKLLADYANHNLGGWRLRVTLSTRASDFVAQCADLMDAGMLTRRPDAPRDGSRFFRCVLEEHDDIPF